MREELAIEIINTIMPYMSGEDLQDVKLKLTMILNEYEIGKRCTELAIADEDKNTAILRKFVAAKLASGRTTRTLTFYRQSLESFFRKINKNYDEITAGMTAGQSSNNAKFNEAFGALVEGLFPKK
jgi:hypothetical protein